MAKQRLSGKRQRAAERRRHKAEQQRAAETAPAQRAARAQALAEHELRIAQLEAAIAERQRLMQMQVQQQAAAAERTHSLAEAIRSRLPLRSPWARPPESDGPSQLSQRQAAQQELLLLLDDGDPALGAAAGEAPTADAGDSSEGDEKDGSHWSPDVLAKQSTMSAQAVPAPRRLKTG